MLETLWYMLILVLQVVQTNPQLQTDRMQIDVFVASKNVYSFTVQGNAVQGQIVDAETRTIFGEFESTRRLPQAYVVFPRRALPEEIEAAAKSSGDKGAAPGAAKTAGSAAKASAAPMELGPFTIDFTKALKQLVSFKVKPRQSIEFTEKSRFLDAGKDAAQSPKAKPTPSPTAVAAASGSPAALPGISPSPSPDAEKASLIEIRYYSNRLVLSAEFAQLLIIVNFM